MMIIILEPKKNLGGGRANQLAGSLADAVGKLRIVHGSRQDQRANQGRGDAHRLVVGCAPTPFGELALDEPNEVLDAPTCGAAYFCVLARHFAPCRGDDAAQLRSVHEPRSPA